MCDLFLFVPDIGIANYVDDNTPHATNKHHGAVLNDLEQEYDTLLKWFADNLLKSNEKNITSLLAQIKKDI